MDALLEKYKTVSDPTMKLWILPYINYLPLYNDLIEIKNFKYKIYKVGAIKNVMKIKLWPPFEIKREVKEEKIDYTKDIMERDINTLPSSIKNAKYNI